MLVNVCVLSLPTCNMLKVYMVLWYLQRCHAMQYCITWLEVIIIQSSRVPVEGKSSMCAICIKYRKNDYIIIIISLGQILLSYIANTSHTHAHTHALTHTHTQPPTHNRRCSMNRCAQRRSYKPPIFDDRETMAGWCFIQINNARATRYSRV